MTFVGAALLCGTSWLAKTALIAANGGTSTNGGLVALGWALGMLGLVVACASGAALLARRGRVWLRVLVGMVAVPVGFTVFNLVDSAVKAAYSGDGWFADELGLLLMGVALAATGLAVLRSGAQNRESSAVPTPLL
jgi:hypothetical protein